MKTLTSILIALTISLIEFSSANIQNDEIDLEVVRHFSCQRKTPSAKRNWTEKIQFPSLKAATQLIKDPNRKSCYKIGGKNVKVNDLINRDGLQVHIEVSRMNGHALGSFSVDPCVRYDQQTKFGGFGSCLYRSMCPSNANPQLHTSHHHGAAAWLTYQNRSLSCSETVDLVNEDFQKSNGLRLNDFYLHFCLPTKQQFLRARGVATELWDELNNDAGSAALPKKTAVYLVARIFDTDQSEKWRQQIEAIEDYQSEHNGNYPPNSRLKHLPFNEEIHENKGFIACHRIIANIVLG